MYTFSAAKLGYANLWRRAVIKPARKSEALNAAQRILAERERYEAVALRVGHPSIWPLIGAIHDREAGGSFAGVLHNGEHIIGTGQQTSLVPAGRGPFATWEEAAIDALTMPGKQWDRIAEWPIERWLYQAEAFNGWGYVNRGVNSPYVWAATNLQQPGKYVADHVWSATAQDRQLGVAAVLKAIFELEPGLEPESDAPPPQPVPQTKSSGPIDRAAIERIVLARLTECITQIVNDLMSAR